MKQILVACALMAIAILMCATTASAKNFCEAPSYENIDQVIISGEMTHGPFEEIVAASFSNEARALTVVGDDEAMSAIRVDNSGLKAHTKSCDSLHTLFTSGKNLFTAQGVRTGPGEYFALANTNETARKIFAMNSESNAVNGPFPEKSVSGMFSANLTTGAAKQLIFDAVAIPSGR